MIKKITTLYLFICFYAPASVYDVSAPVALNIIGQADETIWIFINIDLYDMPTLYTRNYKDVFKYLRKTSPPQYKSIKANLNKIMQLIHPLYSIAYGSAQHILGITRRALSWSHLVRATCYQQNIVQPPARYQIMLPSQTPELLETNHYIELNTGILYIDNNCPATCIAQYIHDAQVTCHGIIYVSAHKNDVLTCVSTLQQNYSWPIIGLYLLNETLTQETEYLQEFNNYLEQLYRQITQDSVEDKINRINQEMSKQASQINLLEKVWQQT